MALWGELKRRNVVKVAVAYAIVGWLLIEVSSTVLPTFQAPEWVLQTITFVIILGFPLALVFSWVFDLTPQGVVRTESAPVSQGVTNVTGRKLDFAIIGALVLALGFVVYNYESEDAPAPSPEVVIDELDTSPPTIVEEQRAVLPNSVAVLPFENLSLDPEDAFFATGIHDELLNQLAKIRDLNVIARTSVLRYVGSDKSIPEIAKELNVETIMEGTVRYAEGSVRVTTQLIDTVTEAHLWSETYTRPFENIFEIETDIAREIANALEAEFSLAEQESLATQSVSSSPEAFALYIRAIELWQSSPPTPEILASVEADLERVIALDPGFAQPDAVLADIYAERLFVNIGTTENWRTRRVEIENRAVEHAERAIELDPNLGYAYSALGKVHEQNWRGQASREAFERSIELSPNNPEALIEYAWFKAATDDDEEAIRATERIAALDPSNADLRYRSGVVFGMAQDHDRAAIAYREAIELDPAYPLGQLYLGAEEAQRGNYFEAVQLLRTTEELYGQIRSGWSLAFLAYGYGLAQRAEDATRIFNRIEQLAEDRRVGSISWAIAYLGLRNEEQALQWLHAAINERVADEGAFWWPLLKRNVWGDPMLEQPEFLEVRQQLGFPDL